jgi:hypothetical protein
MVLGLFFDFMFAAEIYLEKARQWRLDASLGGNGGDELKSNFETYVLCERR